MNIVSAPAAEPESPRPETDPWFDWLLNGRHGGDAAYAAALAPLLADIRDRVLDHARLSPGDTIADIGCGDGLMGFGALARQPQCSVTFVDRSAALIEHVRATSEQRRLTARSRFVVACAERLDVLPDASVDVVLVRAVLAYVADKATALRELRRILRPGGRISIVDPIFADNAFALAALAGQRVAGATTPTARYIELLHRLRSAQYPDSIEEIRRNPLTNYNERDLVSLFVATGFLNVRLRLHIDCVAAPALPWHAFLAGSPYAGVPSVGEILQSRFSPAERDEFERLFRVNVESGRTVERNINAYLFADNP